MVVRLNRPEVRNAIDHRDGRPHCTRPVRSLEAVAAGRADRRVRRHLRRRRRHRAAARPPAARTRSGINSGIFVRHPPAADAGRSRLVDGFALGGGRRARLRLRLPDRHPDDPDRQPRARTGHPRGRRRRLAPEGTGGGAAGQGDPAGRAGARRGRGPRRTPAQRGCRQPRSSRRPRTAWPTASRPRPRSPYG